MLRRQYQEKFLKKELEKAEKIKSMEKEIDEVFYLFEELYDTTKLSEKEINIIEDNIKQTKKDIVETEDVIIESNNNFKELENINTYVRYALAGGIGSLGFVFNTYIGIGTVVGGCMLASLYSILRI